jgi:hypothetical protein
MDMLLVETARDEGGGSCGEYCHQTGIRVVFTMIYCLRKTSLNIYHRQRKLRRAVEETRFSDSPRGISVHTIPVWDNIGTIKR